jgi:hypothetical protein
MPTNKPAGPGWFSVTLAILSILVVIAAVQIKDFVDPDWVFLIWVAGSGLIMLAWGAKTGFRIGKDTISAWVAILAVTFAILAIITAPK